MMYANSSGSLPPDKIFVGRIQERRSFQRLLHQWETDLSLGSGEQLNEPPSPHQRIPGLAVFLFGRGGIGKSTLLRRFHQMVLAEVPHFVIALPPIDWEFAIGDNRSYFNPPPGSRIDPLLYFDLLQKHLQQSLGKKDDFKEYKATVYKVNRAREQAQRTFLSLKQDERFSWLPKLISETMIAGLGALFPLAGPLLQTDVVKNEISQGLTFTATQIAQLRDKLREKLDQNLTYYLDPGVHLGLALGKDLAQFAKNKPILFFFDTYEEIDEGDLYLRTVMGAAGSRVGWVIAGRDDIWSGLEQQKRYIEQIYGYKDLALPQRSLALDFNSGSIGLLTLHEIIEYFKRFQQEIPELKSQPPITEDEANALLGVTLGVPLAIRIAAGLYQETRDFSVIVNNHDKKLKVVHAMVQRYLLHTRSDQEERAKLYGLAMLRRTEESSAVAVALGLSAERLDLSYEPEIKRLQRRYSFIFSDKEQPSLHQEVRYFMRIELFERRKEPIVQGVNNRLIEIYQKLLYDMEEQYKYQNLRQRFEDEAWMGIYLDLTEQLFWKEASIGMGALLFFMLAAAVYQRAANQEAAAVGEFFTSAFSRMHKEWWHLLKQSMLHEYGSYLSAQQKQQLFELERQISQRSPRFPVALAKDYSQEALASLWWRIGEAYEGEDNQQALKWYKKALQILPEENELRKALADTAVDIAYQLKENRQYKESLMLLQQAVEWDTQSAWAYAVLGDVWYSLEDYAQAIVACNQAIELDPMLDLAFTVRGNANAALKQYTQAIADQTRAIDLHHQSITRRRALSTIKKDQKIGSSITLREREKIALAPSEPISTFVSSESVSLGKLPDRSAFPKDDLQLHKYPHSFLELQPVNVLAYRSRGAIYAAMQNYEQALADYDQAIALDPEDAIAYGNRGEAHAALGHYEQALADYSQALTLNPEDAWAYAYRGEAHASLGNYEQALADYSQALSLNPEYTWVYADRGIAHSLLSHYEQALSDLDRAIADGLQDAVAYARRGQVHASLGNYEQALADYDQALTLNPVYTWVYANRGRTHATLEHYEQALVDYDQALTLDPEYTWVYANRGIVRGVLTHYEQALADLDRAIADGFQDAVVYARRGEVHTTLGHYEQALVDYDQALTLDPQDAWVYANRGIAHSLLSHYEQALADLDRAIADGLQDAVVYAYRGEAHATLGHYEQALVDYDQALSLNSEYTWVYANRGIAHSLLSHYEQALADLDRAIADGLQDAVAYAYRGAAHTTLGHYEQALADYDQALSLSSQDAWVYANRGYTHATLGHYEQALVDYNQALTLDPQDVWVYANRGIAHSLLSHSEQALVDLDRAIADGFQDAVVYARRGAAHAALEHYEQALADYDQALSLSSQDAWVYANRGYTHATLGHYEQALVDYNQALTLDPQDAWVYANRGYTHGLLKHYEQALADLDQAISLNPDDTYAYLERAYVYLRTREREKALKDFHSIVQLDPSDVNASWMIIFASFEDKMPGEQVAQQLEIIAERAPLSDTAATCRGVALGFRGRLHEASLELEHALQLIADTQPESQSQDAAFWYGMVLAYRGEFTNASLQINRALDAGLPPLLLTPLYWLRRSKAEFFRTTAQPLLMRYEV